MSTEPEETNITSDAVSAERAAREALAERVGRAPMYAESVSRRECEQVALEIVDLVAERCELNESVKRDRLALNERISDLRTREKTLTSVVAVFDRLYDSPEPDDSLDFDGDVVLPDET